MAHAPIDNTHSPFKRLAKLGPGPRVNAPRRGYKPKSPASGRLVTYRGTF